MKLIHNDDKVVNFEDCENPIFSLSYELRSEEENFYKIFDFNPCPMTINDIESNKIIDVNQSFLDNMGFNNKFDIIGKTLSKDGFDLLNNKDKEKFISELNQNGCVKDMFVKFKNVHNENIRGLFSGTFVELNGKKCILINCQIINNKCIKKFLLNYII